MKKTAPKRSADTVRIVDVRRNKHPELQPFKVGEDARRGSGKPGRSGRKKNAFKAMCRTVLSSERLAKRCKGILRTGADKDVLSMMKTLAEYVETKPVQKLDVTTTTLLEDLVAGIPPHGAGS